MNYFPLETNRISMGELTRRTKISRIGTMKENRGAHEHSQPINLALHDQRGKIGKVEQTVIKFNSNC